MFHLSPGNVGCLYSYMISKMMVSFGSAGAFYSFFSKRNGFEEAWCVMGSEGVMRRCKGYSTFESSTSK